MKCKEIKIKNFDPILFFRKAAASQKNVSFLHGGRWSIIAFNPTKKFISNHPDFEGLKKLIKKTSQNPAGDPNAVPFCGGAIGYFSYDLGKEIFTIRARANKNEPPLINLNFYNDFLCFDNFKKKIFTSLPGQIQKIWETPCFYSENTIDEFKPQMSKRDYNSAFKKIQKYIIEGDIYQVNLTHRLVANFHGNHADLFCKILETNPAPFAAYLDLGEIKILSASPERFLKLEGRKIYTCPVKGTRPRGQTPAEDLKMKNELIASEKEKAELNMITDLLRNDIGQVSEIGSVKVVKHRALQKCPTVWHTYSEIVGNLRKDLSAIDLLRACFPGGSITGCPKKRAMEIIDELEPVHREIYTGAIGYISDCGNMDMNIAIRTLTAQNEKLFLNVGGGIVADSSSESEYEETLDKAKSFLRLKNSSAIFDPANKKSHGVFETMRTYGGKIFMLDAHMERLKKSAKIINMNLPYRLSEIKKMILKNAAANLKKSPQCDILIKAIVTPQDFAIRIIPLKIAPAIYKGVSATCYKIERHKPKAKALPYNKNFEAHEYAENHGFYEAFLVNKKGFVKEGAYSNVFWVKNGQVFTVGSGALEGITKQVVCAATPTILAEIKPVALQKMDEVFITKTSTGIVPITSIDGKKIGTGKVGTTTKSLINSLSSNL